MTIVNVPLEKCSTAALLGFFRYMIGVSGFEVGLPAIPLGDLFAERARAYIESRGGRVHRQAPVQGLIGDERRVAGLRFADGHEVRTRRCIACVPPRELHALLPRAWSERAELAPSANMEPSPYVSVYLWFDRKLSLERFWTKVFSPQTLNFDFYDLSNIRRGLDRGSLIASNIIYSARIGAMSDEDIIDATIRELAEYLPDAAAATVLHARVHRIPIAVPAAHPGVERARPSSRTSVEGLFLAGDWIDTGLPFSMESAVRAGWLAAEAVLADAGEPRAIASPLPEMEGFVRLVGGRAAR
jgi:15-cis-phytoene desaturase